MSAFLCNPQHVGTLAAFAVMRPDPACKSNPYTGQAWDAAGEYGGDDGAALAVLMGRENLKSVGARYPDRDHGDDWGYGDDTGYLLQCSAEGRRLLGNRRPHEGRGVGSSIGDEAEPDLVPLWDEGPQGCANIWQMANCYAYQTCEHDGWRDPVNVVRLVVERIQSRCFRIVCAGQLERAPWEYREQEQAPGPTLVLF